MAKLKSGYLFLAFAFSGLGVALSLVSMFTEQWVVAELKFSGDIGLQRTSSVKYGLFSGVFWIAFDGSSTAYLVTATCSYLDNSCAYLCKYTDRERKDELSKLIENQRVQFDLGCPQVLRAQGVPQFFINEMRGAKNDEARRSFLNAGLYLSTVIFLSISTAFGGFASGLAFWNLVGNPNDRFFTIRALFYYNCFAFSAVTMAVVMWGGQFAGYAVEDVGLLMTITDIMQYFRDPMLGYSYWINFGSMLFYCLSFLMLYTRKILIESMGSNYILNSHNNQLI